MFGKLRLQLVIGALLVGYAFSLLVTTAAPNVNITPWGSGPAQKIAHGVTAQQGDRFLVKINPGRPTYTAPTGFKLLYTRSSNNLRFALIEATANSATIPHSDEYWQCNTCSSDSTGTDGYPWAAGWDNFTESHSTSNPKETAPIAITGYGSRIQILDAGYDGTGHAPWDETWFRLADGTIYEFNPSGHSVDFILQFPANNPPVEFWTDDSVCVMSASSAAIGNYVWHDTNKDGIQNSNEAGIAGVTVRLYNKQGVQINTTQTSRNGSYIFDNLTPGHYSLKFNLKSGYEFSPRNAGTRCNDSDAKSNGKTDVTRLSAGEHDMCWDAGMSEIIEYGSIGDWVWYDRNHNGIQDVGETGVWSIKVNLIQDGQVIATQTTDQNGKYLFENLIAGVYQIQFDAIGSGWAYTLPNQGPECLDSDVKNLTDNTTDPINLAAGEVNLCIDAGMFPIPTITPSPTPTPTNTPTPTPTNTPTPTPTGTPSPSPTPTNTPTPTPTNTPTPTPTIQPGQVNYEIKKKVRKVDTQTWKEKVTGVREDQQVEFKITIKNTGDTMIEELKVVDILPENLTLASDANSWVVTSFAPGAEYTLTITATANVKNIAQDDSQCVVNTAQIKIDGDTKASDNATVCIKNPGEVLGDIEELPDTGLFDEVNPLIGWIVVSTLFGFILLNLSYILQEKYRQN